MQWKTLKPSCLNPEEWGWKLSSGKLIPIDTDSVVAPAELLKVIKCSCKTDTAKPCSSQNCTCVKNGLPCVSACKHCNGEACNNTDHLCREDLDDCVNLMGDDEDTPEDFRIFDLPWIDEEVLEYC